MTDRRFLVAGVAITLAGIAFFVDAALAFQFPVDTAILTIAGGTAAVLALVGVSTRRRTFRQRTDLPDPGTRPETPGAALEADLDTIARDPHVETADERETVYERLVDVAIQQLQYRRGLSPEAARRRLSTGAWTDDPEAAAFFQTGPADEASFVERLRESFSDDARFARRARRVAAALDEMEAER